VKEVTKPSSEEICPPNGNSSLNLNPLYQMLLTWMMSMAVFSLCEVHLGWTKSGLHLRGTSTGSPQMAGEPTWNEELRGKQPSFA
jgi:hypothetical protein